jgi:hypothetical protein
MTGSKVFGIGFQKTGTTSLKRALEGLGYRVAGKIAVHHPHLERAVRQRAFRELDRYDAFQDNPWPLLYRELDQRCPESRFILTLRPTEAWIESVVRHFGITDTPMREWIYGIGHPLGNEERYIRRYEAHNRAVLEYFADRPEDLLVFGIGKGHGWPELCGFLGREVPSEAFPHGNSRREREAKNKRHWLRRGLRRRIRLLRVKLARRLPQTASAQGRWW